MKRDIVIYNDEGVGENGLVALQKFFAGDEVWLCNADALIDGRILQMADIFVMPGGADKPYARKLNGAGNENIRAFVEDGGVYLGICAGAYYACRAIEFHKGREDEICEGRELALVHAVAEGSLPSLAQPFDNTLASAAVTNILLEDGASVPCLYHGGCLFKGIKDDSEIMGRYADLPGHPPAIVRRVVGDGLAILSGVHFEMSASVMTHYPAKPEEEALRASLAHSLGHSGFDWHAFLQECMERE